MMNKFLVSCVLFFCSIAYVSSAGCHGVDDPGTPNLNPILNGHTAQKLIKTVKNGKLYHVSVPNGATNNTNTYNLIHVYGTAYEMGFAQGQLIGSDVDQFLNTVWVYLQKQIQNVLPGYFPKWFDTLIEDLGLDAALDLTEELSKDFTNPNIFAEIHGICDGAGKPDLYDIALKVHMIAGLTQGACSMFGAHGSAIAKDGHLLQLRALDWNMDGPFRDYSQITVYHPSSGYGHALINIGFSGFVGGLTGVSETQLGISEIGVSYPDATFGDESRIGVPFIFLLRDILQYDFTVDNAISRMATAERTCDLILGVGDGKLGRFNGFEYSYSTLNVFDWMNQMPYNETWHPRIQDIVYWGMDWICPAYNKVLSDQLKKYHGKLTAEIAISYVTAVEKSGDNHLAYYDLTSMEIWVSFAAPHGVGGPVAAYDREFTWFDANQLLSEKPPKSAH